MKLFELTSGLIAVVVIALGVNHFVQNNTTPIEEESVVEKSIALVERWASIEIIDPLQPPTDPDNQKILSFYTGGVSAPCNEQAGTICAVKLQVTLAEEELEDLHEMTIHDVLDQGLASYTGDYGDPEYSYFQ